MIYNSSFALVRLSLLLKSIVLIGNGMLIPALSNAFLISMIAVLSAFNLSIDFSAFTQNLHKKLIELSANSV